MSIDTDLSYILVSNVWICYFLVAAQIWFLFPKGIYYWDKVCQNCSFDTKYRFVIRFFFAETKKGFDKSRTTVSFDFITSNKQTIVFLSLLPKQLEQSVVCQSSSNITTYHLILYRKEPLNDLTYVIINHNGNGQIKVSRIEIQEMDSTQANIVYVDSPISSMPPHKAAISQRYAAKTLENRPLELDLKPSVSLTALEYLIFFLFATNLILVLTLFLTPCKEKMYCPDYRGGLLSSVFSGLLASALASIVFFIQCFCFRHFIKKYLFAKSGNSLFPIIRYVFLSLTLCLSGAFGVFVAIKGSNNNYLPKANTGVLSHEVFWMFAFGIGIVLFFLLIVPIFSVIGYIIGFFSDPEEKIEVSIDLEKDNSKTHRSNNEDNDDLNNSDYYSQLMKGNQKVKSISQYKGIGSASALNKTQSKNESRNIESSKSNKSMNASKQNNKKKSLRSSKGIQSKKTPRSKNVTNKELDMNKNSKNKSMAEKHSSKESVGSGYFKELMKGHEKVKSVSQYG